jgi:CheY-like chemotaxis protein
MDEKYILLVEDNVDDELLTLHAFKKNQIANRVVVARDGREAVDYLSRTGSPAGGGARTLPAFMLLDLKLPKLDGLEVLRQVRASAQTQFLPVVVLTSSNEESDIRSCYRLGANSYLRKSVDYTMFVENMKLVGRYWLELNQPVPPSTLV